MDTEYDEFGLLADNASEAGLSLDTSPLVRREYVQIADGQQVSVLIWGSGEPSLVFLHGGAQNAHTWDTVALALGCSLIAVDLPGHGRSDWRADRDYWPSSNAEAIATVVRTLAPEAEAVIGVSLGGLTAIALAARHPELVRKLVVVDVTPGVDNAKSAPITAFVQGPESFASFAHLSERTVRHHPGRSESSLRRGLLHNAKALPDGRWAWRYDRMLAVGGELDFGHLWPELATVRAPAMLVLGELSGVVSKRDISEFLSRMPAARIERVAGAGHSVQGDRPVDLADLIEDFVFGGAPS